MKNIFKVLIVAFVCSFSAMVVFGQTNQEQQSADQKITQLQKILDRAAKSGTDQASEPDDVVLQADVSNGGNNTTGIPVPPVVSPKPSKPKMNPYEKAFSNVVNQMLPMSPEQVSRLREVYTESQLAAATPPGIPPKPTSSSLLVDLSPQAAPPVIRLGKSYISSLVFMDATGQPWPIGAYSIGDPSSFNIQWDRKGNTLLIQSSTFYKRSNLAVILKGLNTPIMIDLISGQTAIDYRIDLRIPGVGPNAVFSHGGVPASANPELLNVLNGVPPEGSKTLKVKGGDCQAWLLNKKLYLRTNLTIISPGWESIMSNIDGTHAYQLQPAPIILALQNGRDKTLTLMLEGLE